MMNSVIELPKKASSVRAMRMKGSEAWKSTIIISTSSTQPRKCAAMKPMIVPKTAPISVPASATDSDICNPATSRATMSRPMRSVPSGYSTGPPRKEGGFNLLSRFWPVTL